MPLAKKSQRRLPVPAEEKRSAVHFKQVVRNEKDRREVDYPPRRLEPRIFRTQKMSGRRKKRHKNLIVRIFPPDEFYRVGIDSAMHFRPTHTTSPGLLVWTAPVTATCICGSES